jgi:hypothetical protein
MASNHPSSSGPSIHAAALGSLPVLRLELRQGTNRAVVHEVAEAGFLVGTVPGCDLRLPGSDLPPVLCLISRHEGGVSLRKLVPTQPVMVNGRPVTRSALAQGDRVTIGPVEIAVQIQPAVAGESQEEGGVAFVPVASPQQEASAKQWRDLEQREAQLARRQEELAAVRKEMAELRQQLYDRYSERRDRLAGLQEAVHRAACKVQEQKRQLDVEREGLAAQERLAVERKTELDARALELARQQQLFEEQSRALTDREQECQRELGRQQTDLQTREKKLAQERDAFQKHQAQYQTDLVRLARLQAAVEQRQQQLQARAREVDERAEQLQRTTRELEEQVRQLDAYHDQWREEARRLAEQKQEQEKTRGELAERAAALEGQQAMLAALRTRLERLREELRREQHQAAERRARLDATEADLNRRVEEAEQLRAALEGDQQLRAEERRQLEERKAELEAAVGQLRQAQEHLATKEKELNERGGEQAEQARRLQEQQSQLEQLQQSLASDRDAVRERQEHLAQLEGAREALQEQLRRRSEELATRQRALTEESRKHAEEAAELGVHRAELEQQRRQLEERTSTVQRELDGRGAELERCQGELTERKERWRRQVERLREAGRAFGRARKSFRQERSEWEKEQRQAAEIAARQLAEEESRKREMMALHQQLPELELRALGASERLAQAREQLREHLAELHAYARQSQEEVEALRQQTQAEAEQVQQQRLALQRARDDHRLAVASFRQQLIEWQGQVSEMKRSLAHGETRLERRQAQVDEQAREIGATSARLAQQAEELHLQERVVTDRREEIERHLHDMREWYRLKLRELSAVRSPLPEPDRPPRTADQGLRTTDPAILTMNEELDPGDRKLGDLLRSLDLVDADTLTTLLNEAQRQRRSLRQALLAGGYLTLYQMALIESSNLDGLMLGSLRVIDRLRVTPREAVYRVFDPRRGQEALLRHLAEAEMEDAVHPDEFRQRFAQAALVQHQNLAATLEVLEIQDRPAALLEWLAGLPSNDWPALAAVPSVWLRLLGQASLGLQAAHQANLIHGHLLPAQVLLTEDGVVKLCGFGEPQWLSSPPQADHQLEDAAKDLSDLEHIAVSWGAPILHRKGAKGKPFPASLQVILSRLRTADPQARYPDGAALLEDIERAAADLPPQAEPWERLLLYVRDHGAEKMPLRQSA